MSALYKSELVGYKSNNLSLPADGLVRRETGKHNQEEVI